MMSIECEGFICPYCLVGFGTSGKLQKHFVDMHSGQGQVEDCDQVEPLDEESFSQEQESPSPSSTVSASSPLGHHFLTVRQSRPKSCDVCSEIIWQDGLVCQLCHVTLHTDNCLDKFTARCSSDSPLETSSSVEQELRSSGPAPNPRGILPLVRRQVAKGRDRYVNDEFDLDLTYITERIIAMSFPATGVESAYRNNLKDVAKMLKTKHEENYMIFNLSERSYDISRFNNQVLDFGWPDHLAPSLERLSSVCKSIKSWLDSEPLHVAVVHCKGGKGRTGCVIAAFMHYTEICHSAAAALDRFAMKRFYDNKVGGVTQPSQKKYVHYFADLLSGGIDIQSPPVMLHHVLMHGIPNFDGKGGCRIFLKVYENMKLVYTSGLYVCSTDKERVKISIYGGLQLQGEVLLKCFHKKSHTGMDSVFRCQFPSAIVREDLRLVYRKADLDDAFKDKRFSDHIKVELLFSQGNESNGQDSIADIRSSLLDSTKYLSNGSTDLTNDQMANRDSYFGMDNGMMPVDDVPDLMGHESPEVKSKRDRSESSTSYSMDPEDIERVTHHTEVYTVINKPFKQPDKDPKAKFAVGAGHLPSRPPPPSLLKKQMSADSVLSNPATKPLPPSRAPPPTNRPPQPPTKPPVEEGSQEDYDYAEPTSPLSSAEVSPLHRAGAAPMQIKQSSNVAKRSSRDSDKLLLDVRPHPPAKTPPEHNSRPVPAARNVEHAPKPAHKVREEKKLELHQKYSRIREELLRKQGQGAKDEESGASEQQAQPKMRKKLPTPERTAAANERPVAAARKEAGKPRPSHPKGAKLRYRPSYTEVEPDFEIRVEPVPSRVSQSDADMWMRVKYPTMPKRVDSMGQRSSSSSNLTNSDYYSNLDELQLEGGAGTAEAGGSDSLGRRRHSFTEGEERIIIRTTAETENRESVININTRTHSDNRLDRPEPVADHDYKNLRYNDDGSLSMEPAGDSSASSFNDQIKIMGSITPGANAPGANAMHSYENTQLHSTSGETGSEDYINDNPEGLDHIYSNQDDLLMQMQAGNQPMAEEVEKATALDSSQRVRLGSGASILRFLKNNILKPKQPTEIHSSSISERERDKTLAPFAMSGIEAGKVNRDYEAFFTSAWGRKQKTSSVPLPSDAPPTSAAPMLVSVERSEQQAVSRPERVTKPERVKPSLPIPISKPRSKTSGDIMEDEHSRPAAAMAAGIPVSPGKAHAKRLPALPKQPAERFPPPRSGQPPPAGMKPPLTATPSSGSVVNAPQPPRPHPRLQASNSDAPAPPKGRLRDSERSQSIEPVNPPAPRQKRGPPPVPPPPFQNSLEVQVRQLMFSWYKPKISREEAIEFVLPMSTGSFIVRDSSTVKGGYALTLKITEAIVRTRKKLNAEDRITEDMLVTHFLVQPDPVGVKLQGWSEKPFKSLTAFIASHVVDKMCLPCKLMLPEGAGGAAAAQMTRRQPAGVAKAMQSGAACDLVYLGSVDVPTAGNDVMLAQTVQQLQSLDLSTMNVVTISVSREGVTLQENVNGSYLKRQYPFNLITYCGLDPVTRWNFPNLHHLGETVSLVDKICFGIVHRPLNGFGYSCMIFAEYDSTQPVSSVVNFIQKMMREHKHSSKYM